jgi:hypothetical protein
MWKFAKGLVASVAPASSPGDGVVGSFFLWKVNSEAPGASVGEAESQNSAGTGNLGPRSTADADGGCSIAALDSKHSHALLGVLVAFGTQMRGQWRRRHRNH